MLYEESERTILCFLRKGGKHKETCCENMRILLSLVLTVMGVLAPEAGLAAKKESITTLNASGVVNRTIAVDPTGKTEGYTAVLYDITNGLPTSEANAIAETGEGFIWIGSYAGLIRYDGNTFERLDSTNGITSVRCLYVDSLDRLWIETNADGVAVMERGEFYIWGRDQGIRNMSIRAITEDENGLIYVGSSGGIMTIDRDMNLTFLSDPELQGIFVRDLRVGNDGLIYGLSEKGDIFTLRDGKLNFFLNHEDCRVQGVLAVLPDPENPGYIYAATQESLIYFGSLESNFISLGVKDISPLSYVERFEYIQGQLWICAGNGIGNLESQVFQRLSNLPMDNSVEHVMTDYAGNLWFTSSRMGVMKVVPNQFTDIFERDSLASAVVNATCMVGRKLFIATDTGLLVTENGKLVDSLPLERAVSASGEDLGTTDLLEYLDGVRIRSVIRDSRGRVWIATWRKYGMLRYDGKELMAFSTADGLFSERVRVACERSDGAVLVANTGGVSIIEGDQVTGGFEGAEAGILNTEILTVAEGMNGDILLGSDGGGIYVINSKGETRHIGLDEGLSAEVIMRIKRDLTRDIFWVVTTNSICFLDADYTAHTVRDFPYPNNFDLYENSRGDLWVLAGNGIYVVPAEEMLANGEISPVFYGRDSGLPCITTANSYSELTPDGDLYIAGTTGVCKVNIEKPFENISDLKVAVPYLDVDGKRIYPDESGNFTVPSDTQKVTASSFVYNYSMINPQVSYQLEGFEQNSTTLSRSELAPVDYTNLRGGNYKFVLQVKDNMGRDSREYAVSITKEKKLYEQVWFLVLMGILLLGLLALAVYLYVRRKMRKLEARHQETMLLITEITEAFAKVIDMKDKYTRGHSTRVAGYTRMLAREMDYDEETVEKYNRIALLHDIGKIGVPPEVLNKKGKLTDEEFEEIKSHTTMGYEVLKDISIMPELAIGAQAHHERPDGRGYPNHLKGDEIPRVAQIIAVADCFDAMYSNRPYRNRMNFDRVVSIIREVSGTQLSADVVEAFLRLVEKGEFRAPDDNGGGTFENIENIHANQEK